MLDPLAVFLSDTFDERGLTPIPLISTDHDVVIAAGLAVVTTHRLFKNVEPKNIEAVLTFPLPVLATLFELTAEVEGRKLRASAQARAEARRTYEDAIDRGKSAVLHEELLRGIHMISVANIQSGGEVKVTTKWAVPLAVVGGRAHLRIPQTVGDIYGRSSLAEADALLTGSPKQPVSLSVRSSGNVEVVGEDLVAGHAKLTNSRPIDIAADIWEPKPIVGNSAGGQALTLTLSPQQAGERALSLAVLVDHSGSMADSYGSDGDMSAHDAAKNGVVALASIIGNRDYIDIWEFDTSTAHIGSVSEGSKTELLRLADNLSPPHGGTEIGRAIDTVLRGSKARDVLLLTDGLSDELDIEKLSHSGRRISVILIGENSLEAKIGHLAALTGGDIFIATANDLEEVMVAAMEGLRRAYTPLPGIKELPERLECTRNNVQIRAEWSAGPVELVSLELDQAAVAVATSLIVSCATNELASKVAASEGIVTHLTSLVLVDEASKTQEALPALRKVALPEPDEAFAACYERVTSDSTEFLELSMDLGPVAERSIRYSRPRAMISPSRGPASPAPQVRRAALARVSNSMMANEKRLGTFGNLWAKLTGSKRRSAMSQLTDDMQLLARQIDWGHSPDDLIRGNLSGLSSDVRTGIAKLAAIGAVIKFAECNGLSAEVVVVGLLARAIASEDRRANRVWKAISALMGASVSEEIIRLENQIIDCL
mgnify:CR=1 FL=1|jgi:hypothetical protein